MEFFCWRLISPYEYCFDHIFLLFIIPRTGEEFECAKVSKVYHWIVF